MLMAPSIRAAGLSGHRRSEPAPNVVRAEIRDVRQEIDDAGRRRVEGPLGRLRGPAGFV